MNKKITVFILFITIILVAFIFYFTNSDNAAKSENTKLLNNVAEIERNLILVQIRNISFSDFKNKTGAFIHSYYKEAYFDEAEKTFNGGSLLAASTKTPVYQNISRVYTDTDKTYKNIFIKVPLENTTSQFAKQYIFKKENGGWKIFSVLYYYLVIDKKEPKKIIEKFTNFNDIPIEYESVKILE